MNTFGPLAKTAGSSHYLSQIRLVILCFLMLTALGIISARMVELNVAYGRQNRLRADQNRILIKPVFAYRGVILDRSGTALTRNVPIERLLDLSGDDSGPVAVEGVGRIYPFGAALAHAVGYIQSADMMGKTGLEKYYDSTLRGQDGAELIEVDANGKIVRLAGEESPISGKDLKTSLDVNLQKIATEKLAGRKGAAVAIDPVDGSILALVSSPAFDPNLFQKSQLKSAKSAKNQIADRSDKSESDISGLFAIRLSGDNGQDSDFSEINSLLNDTNNLPLFNRAISGAYPPGSIFKLVTAAAGLSEKKIDANTQVNDTGEIKIGDFRYGNWYFDQYGRTEGSLDIAKAIARSNDIFFYKVGEWVGADKLSQWAKKFGLGEKLGIDLPAENRGLIPDPIWKERQTGERWFLGNTYHLAIGQGDTALTPLQAAVMVSAVITGKKCQPHIVQNAQKIADPVIRSSDSLTLRNSEYPEFSECEDVGLSNENRGLILQGMVGVCSAGGTAFPFFGWNSNPIETTPLLACKTGTAQHGGKETKPHAWMAVAGPIIQNNSDYELDLSSNKKIVLVVLLESAGEGSAAAGPVAKEILTEWFKDLSS